MKLAVRCPGERSLATFAWGGQGPPTAVEPMMIMMIWIPYYFSFFNCAGREVAHSSPSSPEGKNEWSSTSIPLYTSFTSYMWIGTNFTFKTFVLTHPLPLPPGVEKLSRNIPRNSRCQKGDIYQITYRGPKIFGAFA